MWGSASCFGTVMAKQLRADRWWSVSQGSDWPWHDCFQMRQYLRQGDAAAGWKRLVGSDLRAVAGEVA